MTYTATQYITLSQLEIPARELMTHVSGNYDHHLHPWIAKFCGIQASHILDYTILRRSVDARKKPEIRLVYKLAVTVRDQCVIRENPHITMHPPEPDQNHPLYQLSVRPSLPKQPIIVGTGPAGMMAAYLLAFYGCQPIILDKGYPVELRHTHIETFLRTRQLNPDSNYLIGEGGAGTYSDGKLYTRIKDDRIRFLLEAYVKARAPRQILYEHHPHIGSDILPCMVKRLRQQIEAWGGEFRWRAEVSDILVQRDRCEGVILKNGEQIEAPLTLIACGHSARALIQQLARQGVTHRLKDFQLGCRIEHPQELIDVAQYGWIPPRNLAGAAEYTMTSRPPAQSQFPQVTTFCMCPGGEIIAATSDAGQLCTNGMSRFLRKSRYANAGLIVNQKASAFHTISEAFSFIQKIETDAFLAGAGADSRLPYRAPAQPAKAFVCHEHGVLTTHTSYRPGIVPARLDHILPRLTVTALREALMYFETVLPGFVESGTLIGVETRVSSPVRFERNPETLETSLTGLYLAGEGAGYAGGIISSALDGLRLAETILTGTPAARKMR